MSWSRDGSRTAKLTNGDQSANQCRFVDLASTGLIALHTAAGGRAFGVLLDTPKANDYGTVQFRDVTKVFADGAVSIGDELEITATGGVITAANSGHNIVGVAEEAAAGSGVKIAVRLEIRGKF